MKPAFALAALLLLLPLAPMSAGQPADCQVYYRISGGAWLQGDAVVTIKDQGSSVGSSTHPQSSYAGNALLSTALPSSLAGRALSLQVAANGHTGTGSATLPASGTCAANAGTINVLNGAPAVSVSFRSDSFTDQHDLLAVVTATDPDGDDLATPSLQWSRIRAGTESVLPGQTSTTLAKTNFAAGDVLKLSVDHQDEHGGRTLTSATVRVGSPQEVPLPSFTWSPSLGASPGRVPLGAQVTFDASASTDQGPSPTPASQLAFAWDLDGDGSHETPSPPGSATASTTFSTIGSKTVGVRVTDGDGYIGVLSQAVRVNAPPQPTLSLPAVDRSSGVAPLAGASDADADDPLEARIFWETSAPQEGACTGTQTTLAAFGAWQALPVPALAQAQVPAEGSCLHATLEVRDGFETRSASASAVVANAAPTVQALALPSATSTGPLQLALTAADPDGEALSCTVAWQRADGAGAFATVGLPDDPAPCPAQAARAGPFVRGESWRAVVTVSDEAASASATSPAASITNSAPLVGVPTIAANPTAAAPIAFAVADVPGRGAPAFDQDGDALTCTATWTRAGSQIHTATAATCTDPALRLPAGLAAKGEQVTVSVQVREAAGEQAASAVATSAAVQLVNAPPNAPAITLGSADGSPLTVGDTLRASVSAADPDAADQAALHCTVTFSRDGGSGPVPGGSGPCATTSFTASPALQAGALWVASVQVEDADGAQNVASTAPVLVLNSPPAVTAVTLPSSPQAGTPLRATFSASDADGHSLTCTVAWARSLDGNTYTQASAEQLPCGPAAAEATLPQAVAKGEFWNATVTPSDGKPAAETAGTPQSASAIVQVGNTLPQVTALNVGPSAPRTADDLTAAATATDADAGDAPTCTFTWAVGATVRHTQSNVPCATGLLPSAQTAKGEAWTVTAQARDHPANPLGSPAQATLTILDTPPTADAGADRVVPGGSTVVLAGAGSDADGDAIALAWAQTAGTPVGLAATAPGQVTFTAPLAGEATLTLSVLAAGAAATDAVKVTFDDDNDDDGDLNAADNCMAVANADQADADADGAGNACDTTPRGHDADNDSLPALDDNCPSAANADQADLDNDKQGDACDADDDGDGTPDTADAFPRNAAESRDLDGDGVGDNADPDDDGDGRADTSDNCPALANADQADLDGDAAGDLCDADDDGDGVPDATDLFPRDRAESTDHDKDGVGDVADLDDDNDRVPDLQEAVDGTDPRDPLSSKLTPANVHAIPDGRGGSFVAFKGVTDARVEEYLVFREASPIVLVARLPAGNASYVHHDADAPETRWRYYVQARLAGENDTYVLGPVSNDVTPQGPVLDCGGKPDQDGDGLCDDVEAAWGLDPAVADSDGDGRSDGDEARGVGGYSLAWVADSDGDGLRDGDEVASGSDPLAPRVIDGGGVVEPKGDAWILAGVAVAFLAVAGGLVLLLWRR